MNKEIKQKWIDALKSGKYKKGKNFLRLSNENGDNQYCCLGVLCELCNISSKPVDDNDVFGEDIIAYEYQFADATETEMLSDKFILANGLNSSESNDLASAVSALAKINDTSDSFEPVIEYIEEKF